LKEIKQKNRRFSQYYAEFLVIAADLDWNPTALRSAIWSGLSEEMKDLFMHTDMPDKLPVFVAMCQKRDNQIRQRKAEKAAQQTWTSSTGSPRAPRAPAPPMAREATPAGTVAGYTGPGPMDLSAGRRRITDEETVMRFADGRCVYYGGFYHRAVDCAVRKNARSFKAAGVEVKEVGGKEDSMEKGKERVDLGKVVLARVPGYPASVRVEPGPVAPVRVRNLQGTPTGQLMAGCYPDRTFTRGVLAGLEPARCSTCTVSTILAPIEN
jgi:hypothetical protein